MPSFSLAMSRIGRFLAAWEISISDLGLTCCEAGIAADPSDGGETGRKAVRRSGKPCLDGEAHRLRPLAGLDLLAVGGLHPGDLEAPVGANHGEAVRLDRDDLAELAADPLGVAGGQRLGVEDFQLLAVERGPGAGRRIAAANEPVDLLPGLAPIDLGVIWPAAPLVGRLRLVLLDARRIAGLYQVDRFQHGVDAHREQPIEIDRAERV